jgi:hypothetical protein
VLDMLGFLIGTACLIGLIATLRGGRRRFGRGFAGCGPGGFGRSRGGYDGCDDGGHDDGGPWEGRHHGGRWQRGGGWGRSWFLRSLFSRLDTSPGQEKVITSAFDELWEASRKLRAEVQDTRKDVARAVRGPSFDATVVGEVFARHDAALEAIRKTAVGAVGKVHEALDERQRERMADLIERGPGGFGGPSWRDRDGGHPYRATA